MIQGSIGLSPLARKGIDIGTAWVVPLTDRHGILRWHGSVRAWAWAWTAAPAHQLPCAHRWYLEGLCAEPPYVTPPKENLCFVLSCQLFNGGSYG